MMQQHKVGAWISLAGFALLMLFGPVFLRGWVSRNWPSTDGRITSCEVVLEHTDWHVTLKYSYAVGGQKYEGTRYSSTGDYFSRDESEAREIANSYPVGQWIAWIYYNPDDPADAVLIPGMNYMYWCVMGAFSVVLVIGLGTFFGILKVRQGDKPKWRVFQPPLSPE